MEVRRYRRDLRVGRWVYDPTQGRSTKRRDAYFSAGLLDFGAHDRLRIAVGVDAIGVGDVGFLAAIPGAELEIDAAGPRVAIDPLLA